MSFSSFAKGLAAFGSGYLKSDEKAREEARLAKLDDMRTQEFESRKAEAAAKQAERDRDDTERKIMQQGASAGTVDNNAAAVTYTDADGQQKTAYQPDLATAKFAASQQEQEQAQIDAYNKANAPAADANPPASTDTAAAPAATPAPAPVVARPEAIAASSYRNLDGSRKLFSGLDAATQAKKYADENPIGEYSKYMAMRDRIIAATGNMQKADEMLKRAKDAEQEGAFRTLALLDAGKHEDAGKLFDSMGTVKRQPGQYFATTTDKDGNKVHQLLNEDKSVAVPDVEKALLYHIGGISGVQARAAATAKENADIRKELLKPVSLAPGAKLVSGGKEIASNTSPPTGYEDVTDPNTGVTRRVHIGTGAKPGEYPKVIADTFKGDEAKIAAANSHYDRLMKSNPGMESAEAAGLAQRITLGQGKHVLTFNPATGFFEQHFVDEATQSKDGAPGQWTPGGTYRLGTTQYKAGSAAVPQKDAQAAVDQMKKSMPAEYNGYLGIIKTPESYDTYINKAGEQIQALRAAGDKRIGEAKTPDEKARIEAEYQAASAKITSEMRRVALVKEFYKPETQAQPGNQVPGKDFTPKPGTPAAVAERLKVAGLNAANKSAADKATKDAKDADTKRREAEVAWMTPEAAEQLSPKEAQEYLSKYEFVLPGGANGAVARALRKQL